MMLFLPHKQSFFHLIGQCVFRSRDQKLQILSRIYIRTSIIFAVYINDIPEALPDSYAHLYTDDISIFDQHKDVTEIKNILKSNMRLCVNVLLVISCQFIMVKIKLNTFFPVRNKTSRNLI